MEKTTRPTPYKARSLLCVPDSTMQSSLFIVVKRVRGIVRRTFHALAFVKVVDEYKKRSLEKMCTVGVYAIMMRGRERARTS